MDRSLYIIDGHAQIYRAYFAVPGLRSPAGEPSGATFGYVGMLLKLLQVRKPTHVILTMDAGTSGREALDEQYKAHRKPMPEDMPPQIERILQISEIMGIPLFQAAGFEADDAMATVIRRIRTDPDCRACKIYMCTKDKDLDQLIADDPPACVMFDIQTNEEINSAGLLAKKGFSPHQARDVLALTGDAVDNIPGIPGVGPKTAAKWIAQFGTIENLIAGKDHITGKIGEAFRANLHVLEKSRKLVELQFDVPVPALDWGVARVHPERLADLAPIFHQLGFAKLLTLLDQIVAQYRDQIAVARSTSPAAPPARTPAPAAKSKSSPAPMPGGLFDQTPEDPAQPSALSTQSSEDLSAATPYEAAPENPEFMRPGSAVSGLHPVEGEYQLVNTAEKLDAMLAALHTHLAEASAAGKPAWLAVDTETDALGSMVSNLCGISLSAKPGTGFYVALKGAVEETLPPEIVRQKLGPLLADPKIRKIGQNIKYDINALRNFGLPLAGLDFDTMVASYVIDSSRLSHGMDSLAADYLQLRPIPISDLIGKASKQISFADVPLSRAAHYSAEDADVTLRLAHALRPLLANLGSATLKLFHDLEMPLVEVLGEMEFSGVTIDAALLNGLSGDIEGKLTDLRQRIKIAAGVEFNQDSPRQLANVLFNQLKLPIIKKTKVGPSTDITVLEQLADKHPVPALIVEYRQLAKLKNTYLDALASLSNPRTGRVHTHFNQTVAETGRLSSSDPNLQNIPIKTELGRQIRKAFVAAPGFVLISADYSQVELRMLAHYCGEPALLEAFANNRDVHRLVAAELNGVAEDQVTPEMRAIAKTVNFGIIYGQTGFGLSQVLKIPRDQAESYITAYRNRFPGIEQFTHECIQQATVHGYVETILGRRRTLPDIHSAVQTRRQFSQRAALNSVIQGSAADLIKLAMVNIQRQIREKSDEIRMLMQIHDELVFECRQDRIEHWSSMITHEMEHALPLKVSLKVDLGSGGNWLECD